MSQRLVIRGSSYFDNTKHLRITCRLWNVLGDRYSFIGFRISVERR